MPQSPINTRQSAEPGSESPTQTPTEHDHLRWFKEHYTDAAQQVVSFFESDNLNLEGKTIADIGCGDGIIDLGVFHKARPAKLIGYDLKDPDLSALKRFAEAVELGEPFPDPDRFAHAKSFETQIPVPDNSFDYAFTWSTFEHVSRPLEMFSEIRRIMKPEGVLFLQIWPFYYSQHGGHLWLSYPEGYSHLLRSDEEIESEVRFKPATDPTRMAGEEYRSLNRLTIDDLQRTIVAGGLAVTKLELMTETVHIPPELMCHPLSALGISGVKLLAVPAV